MKPILVLYATRHGQARRVSERLATRLRESGEVVEVVDAREIAPAGFDLSAYRAALLVSSIHMEAFQREMVAFARHHAAALDAMPTAVFSVSMTASALFDPSVPEEVKAKKRAFAMKVVHEFSQKTGFTPGRIHLVAGALPYREYGLFLRLLMRFIVGRQGGTTDTSRNHEFTDWKGIDRLADETLAELTTPPSGERGQPRGASM